MHIPSCVPVNAARMAAGSLLVAMLALSPVDGRSRGGCGQEYGESGTVPIGDALCDSSSASVEDEVALARSSWVVLLGMGACLP